MRWRGMTVGLATLAACELSPLSIPPERLPRDRPLDEPGLGGTSAPSSGSGASTGQGEGGSGAGAGSSGGESAGTGGAPLVEIPCNGLDDDSDPTTLDEPLVDQDGDGFFLCDDCDDTRASVYPGAPEVCGDGIDQDCDGADKPCSVCGDGVVEGVEICDDGNVVSGDGCRADCKGFEVCGDGLADLATEQCDPPQDGACKGQCVACVCPSQGTLWRFVDVTVASGIDHARAFDPPFTGADYCAGGLALGDYDGDGFDDLYASRGDAGAALWRNNGDGTFSDTAAAAGVALAGIHTSGPAFADLDGDGALDLFVSALDHELFLFRNQADGTFVNVTLASGLSGDRFNFGAGFGDFDRDGDLDLALGHWGTQASQQPRHLWRNDGGMSFTAVGAATGAEAAIWTGTLNIYTFTLTFSDYDDDGWPDLLVAGDFGTSRVLHNEGGTFSDATGPEITDEHGMGMAVGDFNNDGLLDWFVTAILDDDYAGYTGNRLYQNQGDGTFADVTTAAGVANGYWGWAACAADFDNDGHLDIFHTNGWQKRPKFVADPSVLFLNDGDGTFTERAGELGLVDVGQGRSVVCFDFDRDGDIDLAVLDNEGSLRLFENRLPAGKHFLAVKLVGRGGNTEAIGARVMATVGSTTQLRELRAGSNFASQDPAIAHFGLGAETVVDTLTVRWPDGTETVLTDVGADQHLIVQQPL